MYIFSNCRKPGHLKNINGHKGIYNLQYNNIGDFNTICVSMNKSPNKKLNKETKELIYTFEKMEELVSTEYFLP